MMHWQCYRGATNDQVPAVYTYTQQSYAYTFVQVIANRSVAHLKHEAQNEPRVSESNAASQKGSQQPPLELT